MNLRKRLIPGSLPSPSESKLEIPLTYSEGNGIEAQDSTESDSKTQSPPKKRLRYETSPTFISPLKCASSSSSDTKNLRLIQGGLPSEIEFEIPLTYSEGHGSIEEQDSTESLYVSKIQSPSKKRLIFDTPTTNDSEETLTLTSSSKCASLSSSATSFSGERRLSKMKSRRFFSNPRYIGDYSHRHLENPMLRKKYFRLSRKILSNFKVKNKILANQVKCLKSSMTNLQELMKNIRRNFPVKEDMDNALNFTISGPTKLILVGEINKGSQTSKIFRSVEDFCSHTTLLFSSSIFICFNKLALKGIKDKVSKAKINGKDLVGALLMDEISIRKLIEWNEGKFKGISDFKGYIGKENHEIEEAREILVFMVVFLNEVTVSYFFTNGVSSQDKASILLKLLEHIDETGLRIATITFDGLQTNFKMAEILGADFSNKDSLKPWLSFPK
ncbi:uncharacterized protein LOC123672342 [Harmonia axyridis]|uniref:uncharacterized protein LOC123672342 n=1 Tax=Harmonia axyridis TaxID=115357 RepID=UPI001E2785E8|nr:uncharacterized protein LOC123672342 [Harmonia axyridis]